MSENSPMADPANADTRLRPGAREEANDLWGLEDSFPDLTGLMAPSAWVNAADDDVLIVLDTSALLVPFHLGHDEIAHIENIYGKLLKAKRLFVPARGLREFINSRDRILIEVERMLQDEGSAVDDRTIRIPPLLLGLAETQAVTRAAEDLKKAQKTCRKTIDKLGQVMRGWRGNDPVTATYHRLFKTGSFIESELSRADIASQWRLRLSQRITPDNGAHHTAETGFGAFVIWLAVLNLAAREEKDLILVTDKKKPDWFVNVDHDTIYPRPDLIDEYRRASGGRHLRFSSLADLLLDMKAPERLVREVRETEGHSAHALRHSGSNASAERLPGKAFQHSSPDSNTIGFDYSKDDGSISVGRESAFELRFTRSNSSAIYLYRTRGVPRIACAEEVSSGRTISFDQVDSSSNVCSVRRGEVFLARNMAGQVLAGRILQIGDETRAALRDWVLFEYRTFGPGEAVVAP